MDDLISRQAAIENSFEVYTKEYGWCEVVGVDAINSLPSAQQWIPCKKRLPKKPGQYYVSGGGKVWICEFLIISNPIGGHIGGWCNNAANPIVQAWMPLPEPWKGEDNG